MTAFASHKSVGVSVTYSDVETASKLDTRGDGFFQQTNVKELLVSLDPLIQPVLTPFVEGLKIPINEALGSVESDVKRALLATAVVSLATGFLVGRMIPGKPDR
jgi:hypothetical protein